MQKVLNQLKYRRLWADYFDEQGIQYAFFSAANAAALQEARRDSIAAEEARQNAASSESEGSESDEAEDSGKEEDLVTEGSEDESSGPESQDEGMFLSGEEDTPDAKDPRARVLSVLELEELFVKAAPELSSEYSPQRYDGRTDICAYSLH